MPFAVIYAAIKKQDTLQQAANAELGVSPWELRYYLAQVNRVINTEELVINFDNLRKSEETDIQRIFKDHYKKPIKVSKIDLSTIPFANIYQIIQQADSLHCAAETLIVQHQVLKVYISKLKTVIHTNKFDVSFEGLQAAEEADVKDALGDNYHQAIKTPTVNLSKVPFSTIHQVIIDSDAVSAAAVSLGVFNDALLIYLHRINTKLAVAGLNINFDELKKCSVTRAKNLLGNHYSQAITIPKEKKRSLLHTLPLANVHKIIRQSKTISNAAISLNCNKASYVQIYIGQLQAKFHHILGSVSFASLQNYSEKDLERLLKDDYHQPLQNVSLLSNMSREAI